MPKVHPELLRSGDAIAIQAAEALVKAMTTPDWGVKKFQSGKMTRKLEAGLLAYASIPEVKQVLEAIQTKQPIDGRLSHYVKRRFLEKEAMDTPDDLDRWFENVLSDRNAQVIKPNSGPGSRYLIYSDQYHLLAVIEKDGRRVSTHDHDGVDLGEIWCLLSDLLL